MGNFPDVGNATVEPVGTGTRERRSDDISVGHTKQC